MTARACQTLWKTLGTELFCQVGEHLDGQAFGGKNDRTAEARAGKGGHKRLSSTHYPRGQDVSAWHIHSKR